MKFEAIVSVMPLPEILDPQGKAVAASLNKLGINTIDVRVGKSITLTIEADTQDKAILMVEDACKRLLANLITESFSYNIKQV